MTVFQIICITVIATSIVFAVTLYFVVKVQERKNKHHAYKLPELKELDISKLETKDISDLNKIIQFEDIKFFDHDDFVKTVEYEQRAMQEN